MLNETGHIDAVLDALRTGAANNALEVWVLDGGSDDGSDTIVRRRAEKDPQLRLIHNPERTQAHAVNLAASLARCSGGITYLIRADAHADYPPDWARQLIDTATETKADSVVVPMRTVGGGAVRDASADLFNSWLGNGGAPHRTGKASGFVDHGHHALFRLDAFLDAGGYDTDFLANEDAEFDMRLTAMGGKIFLDAKATINYVPRDSLTGVFRQFFRNGRYRMRTSLKHNAQLGLRQLAPIALVLALTGSVALAFFHPVLAVPAVGYLGAVALAAAFIAKEKSAQRITLIAVLAIVAHTAFGFGALKTLVAHRLLAMRCFFKSRSSLRTHSPETAD